MYGGKRHSRSFLIDCGWRWQLWRLSMRESKLSPKIENMLLSQGGNFENEEEETILCL